MMWRSCGEPIIPVGRWFVQPPPPPDSKGPPGDMGDKLPAISNSVASFRGFPETLPCALGEERHSALVKGIADIQRALSLSLL